MRGLCNINVWRRKSGNSMEGFCSHLSCISRIFRPECSFDKKDAMNPCTGSRFPSSTSRGPGKSERILQIRKKASQPIKNTDTIPCSMSPHSRTTSSRRLQDFPVCSALAPDSERPAILSGTDLYPCFCAAFPPPHWEACHLILSCLWFPTNQVSLPPQGNAKGVT